VLQGNTVIAQVHPSRLQMSSILSVYMYCSTWADSVMPVVQLRSALLAYDALATAAETVVTAAGCVNSTAANCSAVVATLRDANAPLTQEIAVGQVRSTSRPPCMIAASASCVPT
jgi:hypothetical protein